jgi:catechol 2,3-dioxygenase-like lactoylglutathione lyase family enzyme
MGKIFAFCLLFSCVNACAGSLVTGGYREAVFSVSNADAYARMFEQVGGWEILTDGPVDERQIAAWGLSPAATAREVVVGNPGTDRGFVRLVQFADVPQQQIRSNSRPWDTGGFYDVNTRVVSMADQFAALQSRDWQAENDPVEFTFGPFVVTEWLARGPDGIVIASIERMQPPLEGWPHLKKMSRLFNATHIVPDIEAARDFYLNKLGFETYLDHSGPSQSAGPNVLGLPHNMATEITRHVSILHPQGTNEGSVELIEFVGFDGADLAELAVPPNLGILMLRFPVDDVAEFRAHVAAQGIEIAMEPSLVTVNPYGEWKVMAIRGPGGVWLEFFAEQKAN